MTDDSMKFHILHDAKGTPFGVLIEPGLWSVVEKEVRPILDRATGRNRDETAPEPLGDWKQLQEYWDFDYPVDMDVACPACGTATQNWQEDEPRRFRLCACSLGGLVRFVCQSCHARILKRHFKDKIKVECTPGGER